jgi:hypothetical protein
MITGLKENLHYFDDDNHLHGFPSNKCHFDDDECSSSTPPPAPLRRRVGNEVGVEVTLVAAIARAAATMTWAAATMTWAEAVMTVMVRAAAATMVKTKPCASLLGRLLLGSCGSSAPCVSGRSMISSPRWCFML